MAIKTEVKTVTISMPDSAGLYWWRKHKDADWEMMHVTGTVGHGWGLCVTKNTHDMTIADLGGEWGPEIVPPPK